MPTRIGYGAAYAYRGHPQGCRRVRVSVSGQGLTGVVGCRACGGLQGSAYHRSCPDRGPNRRSALTGDASHGSGACPLLHRAKGFRRKLNRCADGDTSAADCAHVAYCRRRQRISPSQRLPNRTVPQGCAAIHMGVLLIMTADRGFPQGSTGSFCEDDGMRLADGLHHSFPDAFSVLNGATRSSALTGCPSSARAPATLCTVPKASGAGNRSVLVDSATSHNTAHMCLQRAAAEEVRHGAARASVELVKEGHCQRGMRSTL
jgi:hypothetical protein